MKDAMKTLGEKKICKKQGDGDPVHRIHVDSYGGFHCKFVLATETLYQPVLTTDPSSASTPT